MGVARGVGLEGSVVASFCNSTSHITRATY